MFLFTSLGVCKMSAFFVLQFLEAKFWHMSPTLLLHPLRSCNPRMGAICQNLASRKAIQGKRIDSKFRNAKGMRNVAYLSNPWRFAIANVNVGRVRAWRDPFSGHVGDPCRLCSRPLRRRGATWLVKNGQARSWTVAGGSLGLAANRSVKTFWDGHVS